MPNICVRWQGKKLDVAADMAEPPLMLKAQLFGMTGVEPDRQKIIVKGKTLSDDSWTGVQLDDGATIMMMGSSAPVPSAGDENSSADAANGATLLAKKGPADQKDGGPLLPCGLVNLGNTCYMNASVQCFKVISELTAALKLYPLSQATEMISQRPKVITGNVKKLYDMMDRKAASDSDSPQLTPFAMLTALHNVFPQFASQNERGALEQQDANECFTQVLQMLAEETDVAVPVGRPPVATEAMEIDAAEGVSSGGHQPPQRVKVRQFIETEFDVTLRCLDEAAAGKEPVQVLPPESQLQLSCFLSTEVRYLQLGIKSKLTEELEKMSPTLGRDAKYERKALIRRLPAYLSVQMVRFFYKEKDKINAKILKDVKFPLVLDVFDLCSPALQTQLRPNRAAIKDYEDFAVERERQSKLGIVGDQEKKKNGDEALAATKETGEFLPTSFADDIGSNNSGYYELKAVITHKGRSSNSGHYVAWVRLATAGDDEASADGKKNCQNQPSKWAMCDDESVYMVTEEDVLKLSGGGDWHCAYVLLYGPRKVPKLVTAVAAKAVEEKTATEK